MILAAGCIVGCLACCGCFASCRDNYGSQAYHNMDAPSHVKTMR